jgi:hypothetical protein
MTTDLLSYLMKDTIEELEQMIGRLVAESRTL